MVEVCGPLVSLSKALKERDKELQPLDAQLRQAGRPSGSRGSEGRPGTQAADWRHILRGPHVAQARLVLQHLVDLPIRVMNEPKPKWIAEARPKGLAVS